jgi:uncharacterized DUF497 family protein
LRVTPLSGFACTGPAPCFERAGSARISEILREANNFPSLDRNSRRLRWFSGTAAGRRGRGKESRPFLVLLNVRVRGPSCSRAMSCVTIGSFMVVIYTTLDLTRIEGFEWDEGNNRKSVEKHDVRQAEVEQVFFNDPLLLEDIGHSSRETKLHALGRTDAGRLLHISFTLRGRGKLFPHA